MIATYRHATGTLEIVEKADAEGGWIISIKDGHSLWNLVEIPEFGGVAQDRGHFKTFGEAYAATVDLT